MKNDAQTAVAEAVRLDGGDLDAFRGVVNAVLICAVFWGGLLFWLFR